jgi:hypothetical protein
MSNIVTIESKPAEAHPLRLPQKPCGSAECCRRPPRAFR